MGSMKKKKCRHCRDLFLPDHRNYNRQDYCGKPECRKASKAASQKRWLEKPENQNYFRGPQNVQRVQRWRKANPGYWRKGAKKPKNALQDPLIGQPPDNMKDTPDTPFRALQDLLMPQSAVFIGLIANFTGSALQDDIANSIGRMQQLGQDIINGSTLFKGGCYDPETPNPARTGPQNPKAVQLARSPPGP